MIKSIFQSKIKKGLLEESKEEGTEEMIQYRNLHADELNRELL